MPVACLIALQAASTMPSPSAVASSFSPSWSSTTVAVGVVFDPPWQSTDDQLEPVADGVADLLGHERLEVGLAQLDLAVGQLLEPGEDLVQGVAVQVVAHLLQRVGEGVAPGVLAQHDLGLALARRRPGP